MFWLVNIWMINGLTRRHMYFITGVRLWQLAAYYVKAFLILS